MKQLAVTVCPCECKYRGQSDGVTAESLAKGYTELHRLCQAGHGTIKIYRSKVVT